MKVLRILAACLVIFAISFTAFYGRYKIEEGGIDTSPEEYKGVITMWQIDNFEGGVGSRKQFLLKAARGFEKQHGGVLVMVINQTLAGATESINLGNYPDIISFGLGLEINGFSEITVDRQALGGMVGNKCFATAWCRGGYALIGNPEIGGSETDITEIENLLVSQGEHTQPLTALSFEGIVAKNIEELPPMDAYVKFVSGKTPYFLGTQRDVNRLLNRGMEFTLKPLGEYNDLYQYVCVTAKEELKRYYAERFVNYLVSDAVQSSLKEIGMYSPFIQVEYDGAEHLAMQKASQFNTISAFTSSVQLKEMQGLSRQAVLGEQSALNKIKNMCVMP